ncbi:hypothetical protein [Pseudorhodobacter antarcticus]|nr:hypothetical protein [Pseudorhodobacter antarcticus]
MAKRLEGWSLPKRMTATSTMYDVGYETAKADLRKVIEEEVRK